MADRKRSWMSQILNFVSSFVSYMGSILGNKSNQIKPNYG
jgi:hypothetical protein